MQSGFDRALRETLKWEGGYSNHPRDPGGATMKGVIQKVYDAYRRKKGQPTRSVKHLSDAELFDIYRHNYWNLVRGDELPAGVDYAVFDAGVNSGPSQAIKWLQRTVGVPADGTLGDRTLEAVLERDAASVVAGVCDRRLAFCRSLKTWDAFGAGWSRRIAGVKKLGMAWARSAPPPPPDVEPEAPAPGKAPKPLPENEPKRGFFGKLIAVVGSAIGSAVSFIFSDWKIALVFLGLIVFLAVFLGRDWIRKQAEDLL